MLEKSKKKRSVVCFNAILLALLMLLANPLPSLAESIFNAETSLPPLNQTFTDNSTIQNEVKPVEVKKPDVDFDETGIEPSPGDETGNDAIDSANAPANSTSIDFSEFYNDKMRELSHLESSVNQLCIEKLPKAVLTPDSSVSAETSAPVPPPVALPLMQCFKTPQELGQYKRQFESAWSQGNLPAAQVAYKNAKNLLLKELLGAAPTTSALTARAIWMDRGSIVACQNEATLRAKIQRLARTGFNLIFFETINAGYPIYPSKLIEQNPMVRGWDPLAVAVDEAHKNNIELHAWVWAFAVGNTRHNHIIGQSPSYLGPILARPELAAVALRNAQNTVSIPGQPEVWLSPAKIEARQFLTKLYSEIVSNYAVDGLQLDYIRYPFQKGGALMGYESMDRFQEETGQNETTPDAEATPREVTRQVWAAWKAFQVSTFVREISISLKKIKPDLTLSTAVFALPRNRRMLLIQQDWETWIRNGWIDVLIPMAYSKSASGVAKLVDYVHDNSEDRVLVYPGISLIRLSPSKLLTTLDILEDKGVMGSTLFAHAQLSDAKAQVLESGEFQNTQAVALPHRFPVKASILAMRSLNLILNAMVAQQNWQPSVEAMKSLQRSTSDIIAVLNTVTPDAPLPLTSRLKIQSRLATIESQLVTWKYSSLDPVSDLQLRYLTPMLESSARLVRYALNKSVVAN